MPKTFISPDGNPEVHAKKPDGYLTEEEWAAAHPPEDPAVEIAPEDQRRFVYTVESDPLCQLSLVHKQAAEGFRILGEDDKAAAEEAKSRHYATLLARKREEIKALYPDPSYCLNSTGTYHTPECPHASERGELLTLEGIIARETDARPCSRCNPPAI